MIADSRPRLTGAPVQLRKGPRLLLALLAALLLAAPAPALAQDEGFQKLIAPFLKEHCIECHGPKKQESQLRLDEVTGILPGNRNLWTMVHERVAAGEMPPKDHAQPKDDRKKEVLSWISKQQRALGVSGTRRLNRRELSAALNDVTGSAVDFAFALPGDGKVAGFDTGAEGLQEASDSVAGWLQITRRAVDSLRFLDPPVEKKFSLDLRAVNIKDQIKAFDAWKAEGATISIPKGPTPPRAGLGLFVEPRAPGDRDTSGFRIPVAADKQGVLRLVMEVSAYKNIEGVPHPHLWIDIGGKDVDFREITATPEKPERLVYEVQVGDLLVQGNGVKINFTNRVEIPYAVKGFENEERDNPKDPIPGGSGLFRPLYDKKLPVDKHPVPYIILHSVEVQPLLVISWPPAEWKADVGELKDSSDCAQKLLTLWMERAWRRPIQEAERAPMMKLYEKLRAEKLSFDDALRAAFQSVLLSAPFRYQASPGVPDPVQAQYAIASRLSFMLWGTPPDAELLRLASQGKLRDPAVLDAQVDRLIADRRRQGFVHPFVMQWLEMEQPITIAQTHINKVDFRFGRYYKASMREETIAYISQLFAENAPAKDLIVSDWTMMNDSLGVRYGYPGIEGGEMRKVKLRPDDPRGGGILGHAGIQSMLCWMGENWVIYRGAWALRHILDFPPPPPPLEVPELIPSDKKNAGKSYRELLKQHQQDSKCSVCHKYMDPAGFAFQNFDISGRWRDVEHEAYARGELDGRIMWRGTGATRPVDTMGALPRGETFKTFAEFKQLIVKDYQKDLVRGIMKNLMVYATGRAPDIDDMQLIAIILKEHRSKGYPLRDLVKAVVRSDAFLQVDPLRNSEPTIGRRPE